MKTPEDLWFLFQFLRDVEEGTSKEKEKQVMIEKALNMRILADYIVTCSYGDLVLIICMMRDYVETLDRIRDDVTWKAYYRSKFLNIADRLSRQIGYDYDEAIERCRKKQDKEDNSDIGEEAMALAIKYGGRGRKKNEEEKKDEREAEQNADPDAAGRKNLEERQAELRTAGR